MPKRLIRLLCIGYYTLMAIVFSAVCLPLSSFAAKSSDYKSVPPFVTAGVPPLVMLVMGRDHKLYYEAYNDASDLNDDGTLDVGYNPSIEYYGYFDSYKEYEYDSGNKRFEPVDYTTDKKVTAAGRWSGDFLNYLTMSRIDCIRKVLYGGKRSVDTATETVLERAYIPNDAHCWGKEYVDGSGYLISDYTPYTQPTAGTRHLFASGSLATNGPPLLRVKLNSNYRIWKWVSAESGDGILGDGLVGKPVSQYEVRVKVGVSSLPDLESERLYTDHNTSATVYKPTGFLQNKGESNQIYFGLITGSYENHLSGGVLRKNIKSINDEINPDTGEFNYKDTNGIGGIIKTIDNFRVIGFNHSTHKWDHTTYAGPIAEGQNYMWGNPTGEMMYEALRYFAGTKSATTNFVSGVGDGNDRGIDLPLESAWDDPYETNYSYCAKPFMMVISDINPSYDTDQLPGVDTNFSTSFTGTLGTMNVSNLADTISIGEGINGSYYIGQSEADFDTACSPKTVTGLGNIRGLCPEEPTKLGGYYSASVAYYGNTTDINTNASQNQKVSTYAVGLASTLPEIEISMDGNNLITLVPFAKTVYSTAGGGVTAARGDFQPTCAITDFYVDNIGPASGKFRVTYEHAEQGSDYDMDCMVTYEYTKTSATTVQIKISSLDAVYGGGSKQHFGYIISGTTADGVYLEIKNNTQPDHEDKDYYLDTPGTFGPNQGVADTNWDDNTNLPNEKTRVFTASSSGSTATLLKNPLWYAAKWGGFEDSNENNLLDLNEEWDKDNDGVPDTYFYIQNPLMLVEKFDKSFEDILKRTASGTAASVISQTRSGEGAVYQAVFYPEFKGPLGNTVTWVGELHSLFVDSYGNMREDTNGNAKLDIDSDRVIVFDGTTIFKYDDHDGNEIIDEDQTPVFTGTINDVKYLWSSSNWLNEMLDNEAVSQRIYKTATRNRYIFTFVDVNNNMVVDSGEQIPFISENPPSVANLTDTSTIYPYLTLFPTFGDEPSIVSDGNDVSIDNLRANSGLFNEFLIKQSSRVANYIRGIDQPSFTSATTPSYTLPEFRSRQVDYDDDGTLETWRMGDIVYSTPTIVSRPAENYHLLYRDASYATFADRFKNRRHVVYAGANDGMFHAFNGGFYDASNKEFKKSFKTGGDKEVEYDFGAELWAYVPYNLLPHLYWLTESDYPHVYYCDLKPKVFDAKVLPDGSFDWNNDGFIDAGDEDGEPDWGTFLVAGMRFGGGEIVADMDKSDGDSANVDKDRTMSSAYFIFDITDPESEPTVVAEIKMEDLGYTTCYPVVVPMKDKRDVSDPLDGKETINENEWYLVFGSGPASADGKADGNNLSGALEQAISKQKGKLYVVDFKKLVLEDELKTLEAANGVFTTAPAATGHDYYQELDDNSFISDPVAVDFDLDFNADAVYFGTVSGDGTGANPWGGKLRRIVIDNQTDLSQWDGDSIFMNLDSESVPALTPGQPIVAASSVGLDNQGNRWVFVGTGRFFSRNDSANTDQQSYYGLKEPFTDANNNKLWDSGELMTWGTVPRSSLLNVTNGLVSDDRTVEGVVSPTAVAITDWDTLVKEAEETTSNGWHMNFLPSANKERNLGQATLLGDLLTFTTYIPSADICSFEGKSNLYAVYYKTGTSYFESVIGYLDSNGNGDIDAGENKLQKKISLGKGLSVTPNVHVGKQEGSKAFVQTSTGAIKTIEQKNPGTTKSGVTSWEDVE